jgi:purine catabolism regulator
MTTLAELLRLALPRSTHVLHGQSLLQTPVMWAAALRPSPPALPHLGGGELVLIDPADLRQLDPLLPLATVIADLAPKHIAGVAVLGSVPEAAIEAARLVDLPLLAVAPEHRLIDVERDVIRAIVNRQAQLERFATTLSQELTNLVLSGATLFQIVQAAARQAHCAIAVHDTVGNLLVAAPPAGEAIEDGLLDALQADTIDLLKNPDLAEVQRRALPYSRGERWVVVMRSSEQRFGLFSAFGPPDRLDDVTRLVADRGAVTCTLELSRRLLSGESEAERRRLFIRDLLAAPDPSSVTLAQRALQWGYELDRRQVAMYLGSDQPVSMGVLHRCAQAVETELQERRVPTLVVPDDEAGQILICCALGPGKPARRGRRLARAIQDRLSIQFPQLPLRTGVGRSAEGARGLIQSIHEAGQALQLSKQIRGAEPVSYYGDMGLFRLLLPLQGTDDLRKFYDETLSALAAYDERQQTNLVETLAAYFAHHGNLSRTADALFVHRNTLLYRMERIAAIVGHDLDDPEFRLMLQVAFKVRQLLPG